MPGVARGSGGGRERRVVEVAPTDVEHLLIIRESVRGLMMRAAERLSDRLNLRLLDIAPQDHEGARPFFPPDVLIETLDIEPRAGATYTADICRRIPGIPDGTFDGVVCTEVLEHTRQPFDAIAEIHRLLRPAGLLFLSVPFNFRIHGPLPDCWRFTEHGLRALLAAFEIQEMNAIETPDRPLMPIHYTVVAERRQ